MGNLKCDIVLGLVFGDEAKSKVVSHYLEHEKKYTHCLRYSGGANAGHTVYIEGKKIITHCIPTGVLHRKISVIGQGCVINKETFFEELKEISKTIPNAANYIKISNHCHIVQDKHLKLDSNETKIGTTRKGIGPCYADKAARTGLRAENIEEFKPFLIDTHKEFYENKNDVYVIAEGAQGLALDIDNTDNYPYCTSSNCGVGSVINNGISHKDIVNVIGVAKCYDTYVGSMNFEDTKDKILEKIGDAGKEYGATTGRRRQVNYLNLDMLIKHNQISGTSKLILNKLDILKEINVWKMIIKGKVVDFENEYKFKNHLMKVFSNLNVVFSESPYKI